MLIAAFAIILSFWTSYQPITTASRPPCLYQNRWAVAILQNQTGGQELGLGSHH
jgi:hypothetical protein